MKHAFLVVVLFTALVGSAGARLVGHSSQGSSKATPDLKIGTWTLNRAKSTFAGPGLQRQTITFTPAVDNALTFTSEQVNPDGRHLTITWTAKPDGADYPVTGYPVGDMVSITDTDTYTSEATLKSNAKPVQRIQFVVSRDGRTLTATVTGATSFSPGTTNKNTHVLEKQ